MKNESKRTGGEPAFDPKRAWERFARAAAGEPAAAFWQQADADAQASQGAQSPHTLDALASRGAQKLHAPGAHTSPSAHDTFVPQNAPTLRDAEPAARQQPDTDASADAAAIDQQRAYKQKQPVKDGVEDMQQLKWVPSSETEAMAGTATAAKAADGGWRTEKPFRRRLRRLAAGVAAAAVVTGLFATPLGDRAFAAMLQTFRIQHIVGVGISADDLASISSVLEHGSPEGDRSFDLAQYGSLTETGGGETRTVTWDEASRLMGAQLLRPEQAAEPRYQPESALTFTLKVDAVNRLLTRLGSAAALPDEADGKAIRLHIPDGIVTSGILAGKPVKLLQFGKPELSVENGIDPAAIREAVLGLPVLPDSLRTKLAAIGDWQNTLPVPAREGVSASVRFRGHDAFLTVDGEQRYLLWLDESRMVLLGGDLKDFPSESAFLQAAEGLTRP
ncbi:hypothetical protein B5M42_023590 [Paenibacillus athensensis]|uniref:DUF4367 domain-containing protein n=1 Tax=Paenibacillus athensensis TaxID=1967502 RepID=A0A4Y8PU85_9BACL|nr:hypothetical protein [Paenibacillus athensensis]MCD1261784.1 hypothetical protein [Paenibacillus athensensis]